MLIPTSEAILGRIQQIYPDRDFKTFTDYWLNGYQDLSGRGSVGYINEAAYWITSLGMQIGFDVETCIGICSFELDGREKKVLPNRSELINNLNQYKLRYAGSGSIVLPNYEWDWIQSGIQGIENLRNHYGLADLLDTHKRNYLIRYRLAQVIGAAVFPTDIHFILENWNLNDFEKIFMPNLFVAVRSYIEAEEVLDYHPNNYFALNAYLDPNIKLNLELLKLAFKSLIGISVLIPTIDQRMVMKLTSLSKRNSYSRH